jgi:biotin-dependent carboxylase-like uncharacterized protein
MKEIFKVLFPGAFTTIQDLGRFGYQAFGVPVSGCLDRYAHTAANILVGNPDTAATLEMTILGPRLEVLRSCRIAIAGGDLQPVLNGSPLPQWCSVEVSAGDLLSFKGVKTGCRAYLAVEGGFDVPLMMGSRSTYPRGGIGGIDGRPLQAGDILRAADGRATAGKAVPEAFIPPYPRDITCRVIPGPQSDFFENVETFYASPYEVTAKADRMGYRLKGPVLTFKPSAPKSIISEAIVPGTIQIPADGQPIVLMGEQTVGGYAKIGVVTTPDRWRLAQLRPGDKVRFERIDIETAQREVNTIMAHLRALCDILARYGN